LLPAGATTLSGMPMLVDQNGLLLNGSSHPDAVLVGSFIDQITAYVGDGVLTPQQADPLLTEPMCFSSP